MPKTAMKTKVKAKAKATTKTKACVTRPNSTTLTRVITSGLLVFQLSLVHTNNDDLTKTTTVTCVFRTARR